MKKKQIVRLNEDQLHRIINECVTQIVNENCDEGLRDMWKQAKSAVSGIGSGFQNNGIKGAAKNAVSNWRDQGQYNNLGKIRAELKQLLDSGQLNPNTTVGQLINGNQFGRSIGGVMNRTKGGITRRGGTTYREE